MNQGLLTYPKGTGFQAGLLGWPLGRVPGPYSNKPIGTNDATTLLTTITASASANTKGSWTELGTATCDADGFFLCVQTANAARAPALIDIGLGPAGQEEVLIENFLVTSSASALVTVMQYLPIPLTAGMRVAARCQATVGSRTFTVAVLTCAGPHLQAMRMRSATTLGANTADSGGTAPVTSGSANTEGSWATLHEAVPHPLAALVLAWGTQAQNFANATFVFCDLAYGPAGSEEVVVSNIPSLVNQTPDMFQPPSAGPFFCDIPAGSRVAARLQIDSAGGSSPFDLIVIGFEPPTA